MGWAVLAGEGGGAAVYGDDQVHIGIGGGFLRGLGADDDEAGGTVSLVEEVMPVGIARGEAGAVAGVHGFRARVGDHGAGAFGDEDQFILVRVPVAQRGHCAGIQHDDVDAVMRQASRLAQTQ